MALGGHCCLPLSFLFFPGRFRRLDPSKLFSPPVTWKEKKTGFVTYSQERSPFGVSGGCLSKASWCFFFLFFFFFFFFFFFSFFSPGSPLFFTPTTGPPSGLILFFLSFFSLFFSCASGLMSLLPHSCPNAPVAKPQLRCFFCSPFLLSFQTPGSTSLRLFLRFPFAFFGFFLSDCSLVYCGESPFPRSFLLQPVLGRFFRLLFPPLFFLRCV